MVIDARRLAAVLLAVVCLVGGGPAARADEAEPGGVTPPRLSYLDGPVSFWRPGAEDWAPAEPNMALAPGDELHTGHAGNAELQVGPRAFVRAWGDTQLGLVDHEPQRLRLRVTDGHVAIDAQALDPGLVVEVQAGDASFAVDRPGYYRVDVESGRTTFTTRRDGHATQTRVEAGRTETSAAPEPDVWDRWNRVRTDHLLQTASARYLPDGVYGAWDLDQHGDWRVVPTYGAVWVPRGAPVGWAPYTTGRWVWDPRFGWTWVDTAAWGWAPYHYGRWVFLDGVWAWAPGPVVARPVYAPALVAFFSAPGVRISVGSPFVSWVALGWGEPVVPWWGRPGFVGRPTWRGWGGPRIVNNVVVHHTTVVHAHDIRRYRNADVRRAVVAVRPERFGRARVQDVRVTEIDTRRLEPVRGPLRSVAEPVRRRDAAGSEVKPTPPRATREGAPAAGPRSEPRQATSAPRVAPQPRREEQEPRLRENVRRPDADAPRPQDRRAGDVPRPETDRGINTTPREAPQQAAPPRSQPRPRAGAPRPEESAPRPDAAPRVPPPRPEASPRVQSPRSGPPARVDSPRPEPSPSVPSPQSEPPARVESPRPETRPRVESPRRGAVSRPELRGPVESPRPEARPRVERSRPEIRSGSARPPRAAAERIAPRAERRIEPRRAPTRTRETAPPSGTPRRGPSL